MKYIISAVLFLVSLSSFSETDRFYHGVWQSSYAYFGKQPYFSNYVIINENILVFETDGQVKQEHAVESIVSVKDYAILKIMDEKSTNRYVRIDRNLKFNCKPEYKFKYDKDCNSRIRNSVFKFCKYQNLEDAKNQSGKCYSKNKFFIFNKKQIESIQFKSETYNKLLKVDAKSSV